MSWEAVEEPRCQVDAAQASGGAPVELVLHPKARDIGAFEVRRLLPSRERRAVGPFVFFDEMGPATLAPGVGMDVRPHPHIDLATVTYLFEGAILHRDSLGTRQIIEPGAVNLMIAGRGITHSERTPPELRGVEKRVHGLQLWIALPEHAEGSAPSFHHHPAGTLPEVVDEGVRARVLIGEAHGRRSPVAAPSPTLYVAYALEPGARVEVPEASERAVYVVDGEVEVEGVRLASGCMAVLAPKRPLTLLAGGAARCVVIGGDALGPRHMFWNFVSSKRERIEQAKADWRAERFPLVPGDELERIPLPE